MIKCMILIKEEYYGLGGFNMSKMIKCKTLVIGSVFDKEVPLNDSKTMNNLINGSEMKVFYRGGHFSYIDEKEKFLSILLNFIGDK